MNYPQIKPTLNLDFSNTKTLDPRINFRRGTPGAYYDEKTYAKAEENLIEHSEDFANAYWTSSRAILTGNQDAPDGTSDAFKMQQEVGQTNAGTFRLTSPLALVDHKEYTLSIYAKAGTNRNYLVFFTNLTADRELTFFNLSSGKAVNVNDRHAASVQDVGNDWYRCSITYTPDSAESGYDSAWNVYLTDNDTTRNPVADDDGFIYIWGAQLEQRDSLTAYTPTNGAPVTKYQPQLMFASPDQPRFDHDVLTGESKGLLIEESRTNLTKDSQHFVSTNWLKYNNTILNNYVVAPDGTLTGSVLSANLTAGGYVGIETVANYITYKQGVSYTSSYYLKKGSHNYCQLFHQSSVSNDFANFNLDTGEVSSASNASIEHVGNGWYRCSLTSVSSSNITTAGNHLIIVDDMSSTRAAPKTFTNRDDNIYIWGAQLEEGSFVTSYIKTSGASATRSADNASITGENFSSWYRQDEGSLYCEALKKGATTNIVLSINDSTDDNRMFINLRNNEHFEITKNSVGQVAIGEASIDYNNFNKICATYKEDDSAVCIDGSNASSDAACEIPYVDRLLIGQNYSSDVLYYYNCHIKKLSYYPQRLTNEELQQLTK